MMNIHSRFCILLLLLFCFAGALSAQESAPQGAEKIAPQESLLIGSGDLLHVQVFDTPEMEQHARVTDAGTIPFSFLGDVKVAGLTPAEAGRQIEKGLVTSGVMKHPQVMVRVEGYATQNASVMGQVQKPGVYEIDTARKVIEVLALAGGLTDIADRHITIQRRGADHAKVEYYYSNAAADALTDDPLVYPGDTVVVPRAPIVYVLGDVLKPGGYPINTNNSQMTALEAIALAGYANHTAAVGRSKLVRATPSGAKEIDLPVGEMQKGKKPDVVLLADDVIYVPFSFVRNLGVNGQGILASATSAIIYTH